MLYVHKFHSSDEAISRRVRERASDGWIIAIECRLIQELWLALAGVQSFETAFRSFEAAWISIVAMKMRTDGTSEKFVERDQVTMAADCPPSPQQWANL